MEPSKLHDENRTGRLCYIIEAALEYFISILVTGAYLARVTSALGFSDSLTGILSSFVSLGCVFQLGSIALFRRSRRIKRPVMLIHIVNQTLFAFVHLTPELPLSAGMKTALFLLCYCGGYALSHLTLPPKTSWLLGLVPDRSRGSFTATKEIVSLIGGMVFTFIMGTVVDSLVAAGQTHMTFLFTGVTLFVLMILHTLSLAPVRETPSDAASGGGSLRELFRNRHYLRVLPVILLWYAASGFATPFYGAYQIKELGFSMTFVSVLSIVCAVVRSLASPLTGRYADKTSFSRMVVLCFDIAAAAFLVSCFAVPANGSVMFMIYQCLNAVAMAGINSALSNLIYDHVHGAERSNALAISSSLSGVSGFLATCVMSMVVESIQRSGNRLMGFSMYPAQFVSGVALVLTIVVTVYVRTVVIPAEKRQ